MDIVRQIERFGIVGIAATAMDYAVLMVLKNAFGVGTAVANICGFCSGLVLNYALSMRYVFKADENMPRWKRFAIFAVLSGIGLALNEAVLLGAVSIAGEGNIGMTVAKGFATAVTMVWNFVSRKKFLEADAPHGDTADGSA